MDLLSFRSSGLFLTAFSCPGCHFERHYFIQIGMPPASEYHLEALVPTRRAGDLKLNFQRFRREVSILISLPNQLPGRTLNVLQSAGLLRSAACRLFFHITKLGDKDGLLASCGSTSRQCRLSNGNAVGPKGLSARAAQRFTGQRISRPAVKGLRSQAAGVTGVRS
jgi:hypothetical protein